MFPIHLLRIFGPYDSCRFIVFKYIAPRKMTLQPFESIDTKDLCCSPDVSVFKLPPGYTAIVEVNESRPDGRFVLSIKQVPPPAIDETKKTSEGEAEGELGMCTGDCSPWLNEECRTDIEEAKCIEGELECVEPEPPKKD